MKIMYHLALDWTDERIRVMNSFNLYPKKGFTAIQIEEDKYLKLKSHLKKWGDIGVRYPEFTNKELKESLVSAKINAHTHGYPMPDMDFGYLDLTYDLSDYCEICGIGKKQKDAFRLKNIPKKGKKKLFSIGWVFDEYFVERELYNEVFRPLGIKSREVLKYTEDIPFEDTVQLVLEETEELLNLEDNPIERCGKCGRWKYQPMPQGFYPKYKNIIAPMFKSKDYFGTGTEARKRIFVSQELREILIEKKIDSPKWYTPTK
ncbi:hypothetical protein [Sinomicrobium sp. M5D2P9]